MTHQTTVIPHYHLYKLVVISPLLVVKNVIAGHSRQTPNASYILIPLPLFCQLLFFFQ